MAMNDDAILINCLSCADKYFPKIEFLNLFSFSADEEFPLIYKVNKYLGG